MKTFADPSFFRLFHGLLDETGNDPGRADWMHRGIHWTHERHSFTGPVYAFGPHQYLMRKPEPRGWSLLVVKEHWWGAADNTSLRSVQWAKPMTGKRTQMLDGCARRSAG